MAEDPRPRHVHDPGPNGCWERVSICRARDLPQHVCDQTCWEIRLTCGYRGLY